MLNFIDRAAFEAVPIIGVRRHRLLTDGDGITALVGFHGCPLQCAYCLNPQCNSESGIQRWITPESLYKELRCDDFYFRSTGGGVCFGGEKVQSHVTKEMERKADELLDEWLPEYTPFTEIL